MHPELSSPSHPGKGSESLRPDVVDDLEDDELLLAVVLDETTD